MNSPFSSLYRAASAFSRPSSRLVQSTPRSSFIPDSVCVRCRRQQIRFNSGRQLAEDPQWISPIDRPVKIVRAGKKHGGPGLILLALIPVTAFVLGTWQVQRLEWKSELVAKFEDRLVRPPLPLPPKIDPDMISEFDYRRVYTRGHLRHDQEMLIGPRMHEGEDGFTVITPLERGEGESTVLINRGWISRKLQDQKDRPLGVPKGEVVVEGLLREPIKKNMFTPDNIPEEGRFYFPDVPQMAELTGSQPVLIEETMVPDLVETYDRTEKGIPIGRPAQVNLRNNHLQYIFTWYGLSLATSVMLWMLLRKRPNEALRRARQNKW